MDRIVFIWVIGVNEVIISKFGPYCLAQGYKGSAALVKCVFKIFFLLRFWFCHNLHTLVGKTYPPDIFLINFYSFFLLVYHRSLLCFLHLLKT